MPKAPSKVAHADWSWSKFEEHCRELEALFLEKDELFMDWSKWSSKLDLAPGTIRRLREDSGVLERSARKAFQKINVFRKRFQLEPVDWRNEVKQLVPESLRQAAV